jgi:tetratricopeptide (TPR) repeat protein
MASGCSSLPDKLKFAKKDETTSSKAVDDLQQPVKFHLTYAQWQEENGNFPEALESYRIVVSKDPQNTEARLGLARIAMKTGDIEQAENLFKGVLKEAPQDAEVLDSLGQFYAEKHDWPRSVALLDRATQLEPDNQIYQYHYAAALAYFGKAPEALAEFREILSEPESHFALAHILKTEGDWQQAEYHVQRALALNPKFPEARKLLDELKYSGGEHSRYAQHSKPARTTRTLPAGYERSAGSPASNEYDRSPGKFEYQEETIDPLDF